MLLRQLDVFADGIAQAAHYCGQRTKALRQRRPGDIFHIQDHASRAAGVPGSRRVRADTARSPNRDGCGQQRFGDHPIETQVAGQGGLFRRRDFQ
jgi:hypothetical protein